MYSLYIEFDVQGAITDLSSALDDTMYDGMTRASMEIAKEVRATHPYTNRTGDLERSTVAVETFGRFMSGRLRGGVEATTPYAGFVQEKSDFEYLDRGFYFAEDAVEGIWTDALTQAVARAGWDA